MPSSDIASSNGDSAWDPQLNHNNTSPLVTRGESVSKKRKADSDVVEPDSDIEATFKKQKPESEADDLPVVNEADDVLLRKRRAPRLSRTSKAKQLTANKTQADKTTSPTISPTTAEHNTIPTFSKTGTRLPQLSNLSFEIIFGLLKRLNTALTPYKYTYFTEAEIARDDALYSPLSVAPLPVPNLEPAAFFGTEEEKRLRNLFPALESSDDTAIPDDPLALFDASWEGKLLKRMEEEAWSFEKEHADILLMIGWLRVMGI